MIKNNPDFLYFLSNDCNRLQFIRDYLTLRGLETSVFQTEEKNHIFVRFPPKQYDPSFRMKTIVAHYDKVAGSQGANDNSFTVFFLMLWALELSKTEQCHNIRLIFTDGEESEKGIKSQGAFALASWFKKLQLDKGDVFVFDCMGRGNIPVLSQTSLKGNIHKSFSTSFHKLEERCAKLLASSTNKWVSLPTAYSDNAGFLAQGISAVTITMLPSRETENYMKLLMKTKTKNYFELFKDKYKEDLKELFPPTWFLINSPRDTAETLTEESETIFRKILDNLAAARTLV